jgi:hypothetical protein
MMTSLQFKPFNYFWIYIAMISSRINQNRYGLMINITFYLDHVGLVGYLSIVQGCINPWHALSHIVHYICFMNFMHIPHLISLVRKIFVLMFSFTSPTPYAMLSWNFTHKLCHFMFTLCWVSLLICLRYVLNEAFLESFLPLIHLFSLFIIPGFL